MREDFEHWWDQEGQYSELCGKELCLIAWSNGEYKAQKELTDEEIDFIFFDLPSGHSIQEFARAILRKSQETNSEQVPDFFFMENDLMGKR